MLTPAVGSARALPAPRRAPARGRTRQRPTIPRLGGLAIFLGVLVPSLAFLPLGGELRGILLGAAVATTVGAIDDFRGLALVAEARRARSLAAAIPTGFGVWVHSFTFPLAACTTLPGLGRRRR